MVQWLKRLLFYADKELNVTTEIKPTFQYMQNRGEFEMSDILAVCRVMVDWLGLSEDERTLEPLSSILEDVPVFLCKQLKKLK
ncbi:unnamed protein product, partial [Choristocarpus tenellus]